MRGNMKLPLAAALLILFPSFSNAQEKGVSVFKSFDYVKSDNPWLVSPNTASLYTLSVKNISTVNVGMTKSDGSYMDVHESGNAAEAGAYTESYVKVSDRMAFSGNLSYSYFTGSKMCGPVLMDPSYNFINFEESTTDNPGRKSKEVFDLSGGINYRLGDIWSLGGKLSYNTANYSKLKDPRFASKWADFGASLGIASKLSDKVTLGIDGEFRKTVESVDADIFGEAAKTYYYIVDYGAYFGKRSMLDNSNGYLATEGSERRESRPMVNQFYGGSLQADFTFSGSTRFFNEISFLHRSGFFGRKSSGSIRYCDASGNIISYKGVLSMKKNETAHYITLDGTYSSLGNEENNYKINSVPGSNLEVVYLGSQTALDKTQINADLSYKGYAGLSGMLPDWEYGAELGMNYTSLTSESYPDYRKQDIMELDFNMYAVKNCKKGYNVFSTGLYAGAHYGTGTKNEDGKKVSATGTAYSGTVYLDRNYEYRTSHTGFVKVSFKYSRIIRHGLTLFAEISDSYTSMFKDPEFLSGRYRNVLNVTVGIDF